MNEPDSLGKRFSCSGSGCYELVCPKNKYDTPTAKISNLQLL